MLCSCLKHNDFLFAWNNGRLLFLCVVNVLLIINVSEKQGIDSEHILLKDPALFCPSDLEHVSSSYLLLILSV